MLNYVHHNCHDVEVDQRRVLFHIPSSALFNLDPLSAELLDLFKNQGALSAVDLETHFRGRCTPDSLLEALQEFRDLEIISENADQVPANPKVSIEQYPLSTLVLNVNTGCNLGCTYCYKEDLTTPTRGEKMAFDTACSSIDLLLKEGASRERINIVFFGGEPLSNLPLIKAATEYAETRCAELGVTVDFSMTTNATLLKEDTVDWLNAHRFSIAISMDGPAVIHDRHRKTIGGKGTHELVAAKARMLLSRYDSRPVGARVTLTNGNTDLQAIHHHLRDELGFFEVGYAPVTTSDVAVFNLDSDELKTVFEGMKALGQDYLEKALAGSNNGFSNMHQLMTDLHLGSRKALPCGAGVGMLAVDHEGELNLCHRFTGSDLPTFGNVKIGIDKPSLGKFLNKAADRSGRGCETCQIRNLCSGGCYHESYAHDGDPLKPVYHYCDLMRDWVDFGIGIYSRIIDENPAFFDKHVMPRRVNYETTTTH
ncbi:quinohemoprotein amine dehydrogenase maturation protein [Granulosicoccus antarcticus]|uniref:Anaerobic sulfatase-maturating enzyme n=1 Tax=Granulosicoccus antarcticus IMCC3135 TaxID=1192854 RepID=A0A2Z2NVM9_9GAMM|nr:quinohemoprotein amine dehydrogenase maturation protein [Granulosicoccus antarcticus]ASJ74091.1 Anaerobic sulfatase-maturating enzyme [Granulosicoccus antarcticus IMCC3135]